MICNLLWLHTAQCMSLDIYSNSQSVITVPILQANISTNTLRRRYDEFVGGWQPEKYYYKAKLNIGTPPVEQEFIIDTTTSDFWVNCESGNAGYFDYKASRTFKPDPSSKLLAIPNIDDPQALGFWGNDFISAFGRTFEAVIGVAVYSNIPQALGLGPREGESFVKAESINGHFYPTYPNFSQLMKSKGLINRAGFSLWLGGVQYGEGTVIFGGFDQSKYTGDLTLLPMIDEHSAIQRTPARSLSIMLTKIAARSGGVNQFSKKIQRPVLLDSTSPISYLPTKVFKEIGFVLNGVYSKALGMYLVACDLKGEVTLDFSGALINVALKDLIFSERGPEDSPDKCALAISIRDYGPLVLGTAFLKSIYVVFDLESKEVAIAQAITTYTSTDKTIVEMVTGIPSATPAESYRSTSFILPARTD